MENSAPSIDVGDELDAVVPEEGFGGVGRSLYESSADRGSFSDLLQMMNEARPDGEDVEPCREPSISKSSCGKRSNRSLGTWKDLVKAKKWKGKDSLLHKIKEKQKDRKVKKRKLKKKGLRTIDREQAAGLNKIEHYKRKDDKDGEYFHLFLLEYFWKLCKFDRARFRQIVMRLFISGIFDMSFHRLQRLVSDRDAVSAGLHDLMTSLLEEFKCFGVAQPRYVAPQLLIKNQAENKPPCGYYSPMNLLRPLPHKRAFSTAALEVRSGGSGIVANRAPSPPLLACGSSIYGTSAYQGWAPEGDNTLLFQHISRYSEEFIEIPGTLGKGGFGSVYRAQRHFDGVIYAIKKIHFRMGSRSTKAFETVLREVRALACLDHPNVCRYYNAWIEPIQECDLLLRYRSDEGSHSDMTSMEPNAAMGEESSSSTLSLDATTDVPSELLRSTSDEEGVIGTGVKIWSLDGSESQSAQLIEKYSSQQKGSQSGGTVSGGGDEDGGEGSRMDDDMGRASLGYSGGSVSVSAEESKGGGVDSVDLTTSYDCIEEKQCIKEEEEQEEEEEEEEEEEAIGEHSAGGCDGDVNWASTMSFTSVDSCGGRKDGEDGHTRSGCRTDELSSPSREGQREGKKRKGTEEEDEEEESVDNNKNMSTSNKHKGELVVYAKPRETHTLFIQMQCYEEETLKNFLAQENRKVDRKENLRIFRQIVEALKHINEKGIYHRDLKPANIFLHQKVVKIGDFGLAKEIQQKVATESVGISVPDVLEGDAACVEECHTGGLGTMSYAAPEQKLGHGKYTEKVDIYPLGIILFELFYPFSTQMERMLILSRIQSGILPAEMLKHYPEESAMVLRMTSTNPEDRPSAKEILSSSLFKEDQHEQMVVQLQAELRKKAAKIKKQKKEIKCQAKLLRQQEKRIRELSTQLAVRHHKHKRGESH